MKVNVLALLLIFVGLTSCYSFKGISIQPEINTFYVAPFTNNARNSPPNLEVTVAEALREKVRTESRLEQVNTDPDIEFQGTVVDFRVSSEAPQPGTFAALNRLTIVLAVEYINNQDEADTWKQNFSFFFDFEATQSLQSIQDQAISDILDQLTEDIFNKAFTNW